MPLHSGLRLPLALLLVMGCARSQATPAATATLATARPGCAPLAVLDSVALLHDVAAISDDSMLGRAIGSLGSAKTRDFLAARFDALGLETIAPGRIHMVPVTSSSSRLKNVHSGANVVGLIRGKLHPDQYIVVTAHLLASGRVRNTMTAVR